MAVLDKTETLNDAIDLITTLAGSRRFAYSPNGDMLLVDGILADLQGLTFRAEDRPNDLV